VRRFALALSLALLAWNNLVHVLPGTTAAYVPLNLAAAAVVLVAGRRCGLSSSDLGVRRDRARGGARLGAVFAACVAAALALAAVVPALRPLFDDARVRDLEAAEVAYHALIRIPFGTVLFEELAFRGALFGALARVGGSMRATLVSSAVFGLFHVRPTLGLLSANDIEDPIVRAWSVAGAVVVTTAAGMIFCLLRVRSDSTVAPIVAHVATNSSALLASAATG
jgi:uncharacterized protein